MLPVGSASCWLRNCSLKKRTGPASVRRALIVRVRGIRDQPMEELRWPRLIRTGLECCRGPSDSVRA